MKLLTHLSRPIPMPLALLALLSLVTATSFLAGMMSMAESWEHFIDVAVWGGTR